MVNKICRSFRLHLVYSILTCLGTGSRTLGNIGVHFWIKFLKASDALQQRLVLISLSLDGKSRHVAIHVQGAASGSQENLVDLTLLRYSSPCQILSWRVEHGGTPSQQKLDDTVN